MGRHNSRTITTPSVSGKAYDLNKFIAPHVYKRASIWHPPSAWLKVEHNEPDADAVAFTYNPFTPLSGTTYLPTSAGGETVYWSLMLNSARPNDITEDMIIDTASAYGYAIAPLDLMSRFYGRARITSLDWSVTFQADPATIKIAAGETEYWNGLVRIGAFLSKSPDSKLAWSQDIDTFPPNSATTILRIGEAYRSGLLQTVPLVVGNDPKYVGNSATISMKNINIMDQFQPDESAGTDISDATQFSFRMPRLEAAGVAHDLIQHPPVVLYAHFFLIVDRPAKLFQATLDTTDTSVNILAKTVKTVQNYLFTEPISKNVENYTVSGT